MFQLGLSVTHDDGANTCSLGKVQQWTERMRDVTAPVPACVSRDVIRILVLYDLKKVLSLSAFIPAPSEHVDLYRRLSYLCPFLIISIVAILFLRSALCRKQCSIR